MFMTLICQMSSILKTIDVVRPELRALDFTNSLTYTVGVDITVFAASNLYRQVAI